MAVGISVHSDPTALVRSGTNGGPVRGRRSGPPQRCSVRSRSRSGDQGPGHLSSSTPNVSMELTDLTGSLCWNRFGPLSSSEGTCNATAYRDVLTSCVLQPLWQQLEEGRHMGVVGGCPHAFGHIYISCIPSFYTCLSVLSLHHYCFFFFFLDLSNNKPRYFVYVSQVAILVFPSPSLFSALRQH